MMYAMTDKNVEGIFGLIFIAVLIGLAMFLVHEYRKFKASEPDYSGFARGLRRIRDEERELDPKAPSVLRLLTKD